MKLFYLTCLIAIMMLIGLDIVSLPILQHHISRDLPVHKTLYVDRNLSNNDFDVIVSAANEWQSATHGLVKYDVVRMPAKNIDAKNSIIIVGVSEDFPEIIAFDSQDMDRTHLAYFDSGSSLPYIALVVSRISENEYKSVLMHELGHSLGLKHNTGDNGIGTLMYPDIDLGSDKITDIDLANFCKRYGCDASQLHDE